MKEYNYNLFEFFEQASKWAAKEGHSKKQDKKATIFTGTQSLSEAVNLINKGWEVETFKTELETLRTEQSSQFDTYHDVTGSQIDVGSYLEGQPECMIEFEQTEVRPKFELSFNLTEGYKLHKKQIIDKGIKIVSIIEALQAVGDVKLIGIFYLDFKGIGLTKIEITVKEYEQFIDLSKISVALHPSFLRRLFLAWVEKHSYIDSLENYGSIKRYENIDFPSLTHNKDFYNRSIDDIVKDIVKKYV